MKTYLSIFCLSLCSLLALPLAMVSLNSCATSTSTDKELNMARMEVEGAQFALDLAQISYGARMTDPKTPLMQRMIAQRTMQEARNQLAAQRAKLMALQDSRMLTSPNVVVPMTATK